MTLSTTKKYRYIDGSVQEVADQKKGIFRTILTAEDIKNGIQCGVTFNKEREFMRSKIQLITVPAELIKPAGETNRGVTL